MSKEKNKSNTQKVQLNIPPTAKVKTVEIKPSEETKSKENNKK